MSELEQLVKGEEATEPLSCYTASPGGGWFGLVVSSRRTSCPLVNFSLISAGNFFASLSARKQIQCTVC